MRIEIINVGDEVLRAETREDNGRFLAGRLTSAGVEPLRITAIPDDMGVIASEISAAMARSDAVIVTGGLGPTVDDMTRRAAIEALGGSVDEHPGIVEGIEKKFASFGRKMPEGYADLARVPKGSEILENPTGAACGLAVTRGGCTVYLLPGVPDEMRAIFLESVLPRIASAGRDGRTALRAYGMMETEAEDVVRSVLGDERTGRVSIISSVTGLTVYLREGEAAPAELEALRERFGNRIYTAGDSSMEEVVVGLLTGSGTTLAVAESLTGGMLASTLVSVPGASASFLEGFVTYSNEAKSSRLGVDSGLIERHGAVSSEVCVAMAEGARAAAGADAALATTGIAGPGGATAGKPVGLCFIGMAAGGGAWCRRMQIPGTRSQVRTRVVYSCLDMLRLWLLKDEERLRPFRQEV